jgi:competence protein ComEA
MDGPPSPKPIMTVPQGEPPVLSIVWPRAGQWVIVAIITASATLTGFYAYGSMRRATRPTTLERGGAFAYHIDVNSADRAELMQLPGVGESMADRIDSYRREHGTFRSVDELRQVRGIGPTTLERLRPWVRTGENPQDEQSAKPSSTTHGAKSGPPKRPVDAAPATKGPSLRGPIDINLASVQDLQQLPGIGPIRAQRIIEERAKLPFASVDDLRRVNGIGTKTLDRLRPHISVRSSLDRIQ